MAPEPPSPSASTVLLPFLGGRPRRGSLASVTSRKEIDKDALAQALDEIHTSCSKTETLTSFHDFDGGAGNGRSGAKELVSSGVSGLYNRLKQSVGGTPVKDAKARPKSNGSRESVESASIQSGTPSASRKTNGLALRTAAPDNASVSTGSATASPLVTSFAGVGEKRVDSQAHGSQLEYQKSHTFRLNSETVSLESMVSAQDHVPREGDIKENVEAPSQADLDHARCALVDDDRSATATEALARVLSHHEVQVGDRPQQSKSLHLGDTPEQAVAFAESSRVDDRLSTSQVRATSGAAIDRAADKPGDTADSTPESHRPPMVRVGPSHLPGFKPSRPSSADGGDMVSVSSAATATRGPTLDPSPNINGGLQRRRTGLKPPPSAPHQATHIPSHLKRRVISKEFWMKDENAKDCFYCGQSFSTFRRKHHCRTCGQIFDAKCTTLVNGRPYGQPGTLRLCIPCEAMIYGSDDDSTVFSDDGEEPPRSPFTTRPSGNGDEWPDYVEDLSRGGPQASEVATPSIGIPASRRNREAKRRSAVIEFDAQPMLARPSSSRSLISLSGRPRSSSHRRHQSRHQRAHRPSNDERGPFYQETTGDPEKQAALPAFHNDNIIDPDLAPFLSDDGSEEDEQPNIFSAITADGRSASPGERERLGIGGLFASAMRKGRSKFGDRGTAPSSVHAVKEDDALSVTTKHPAKLNRRRNPSLSSIALGRPSPRRSRSNMLLQTVEDYVEQTRTSPTLAPSSGGSKVIRSAALRGSEAPPVELNRASLDHVHKLLVQLLSDAKLSSISAWEKALVPILLQCTDDVEPDVQRGDDMDIRHYVKLKKVPGGKPGDTSYVSGVVFSKNVALKSMKRTISSPRIAIVTFAIEYARHQTHFMSLEPVIAQEREYLHNLVGRISALRPHILLVQRNVSGLAVRLLEQAGITVAYNIKESVLAAVARVTKTTMIKSVDKLAMDPSHLGGCESFDVRTYMHQGVRKTYIYLSGCQPDLGCTIVLRGGDTRTLRKIKRITEFMCYVVYNLKLETNLMRDEFVSVPSKRHDQLEAHDGPQGGRVSGVEAASASPGMAAACNSALGVREIGDDHAVTLTREDSKAVLGDDELPSKYAVMEEESRRRILSASPSVIFMQPYLLTQLREQERRLATFKRLRDQHAAADEDGVNVEKELAERFELVKPEMVTAPASKDQPKAVREYLHAVHEAQYDRTLATYDSQRKMWDSFITSNTSPFDPYSHQTIVVLHSTVSSITSAPCSGPELLGIGFYAGYNHVEASFEEDCTLGQYIEDLCLGCNGTCKECSRKMYDHHRQYVHGYGQLSIAVKRQPARMRGLSNTILMWSTCRICRQETTVLPMSDNTWKYSFAKYLELSFWSSPLHPRAGVCQHDLHKDFLRCFGYQDMVVRVQYDAVDIYDIVVPKPTITWKVEADLTVKNEQFAHFNARLRAFVESIKKRLASINVDTLDEKETMAAQETLDMLRQRADDDHKDLLHKLQQKYASSRYYEVIPLNRALRYMDEKALAWDDAFNNFERDYFPSENDIRKLAAAQLKEMFYGSHSSTESMASDASDTDNGTEMKTMASKSLGQRLADEELQSEKATDVLTSIAQEHRSSRDESNELATKQSNDTDASTASTLTRKVSPREDQTEIVERDDVKHLDLAVASRSPEDITMEEHVSSSEESKHSSRPATREGTETAEPFAIQPKPLSSGLLQRIEQIRNNRPGSADEQESPPESKIPRLADLKKRDISPAAVPPLLRAQSQPAHVPRRSADLTLESIDSIASGPINTETPPLERRLGERLGVGQLGGRVIKVPPSLIPRSIPAKQEAANNTSVSALAKHFEQMSREFEKERLRERRQRAARSRQARANPLASSRPVVEVYRNATDAVGEKSFDKADTDETSDEPVARKDTEERATQTAPTSSDEILSHMSPKSERAKKYADQPVGSDIETEGEGSDVEPLTISVRSRDISDPVSALSSTLVSPSAPDLELHPEISIPEHKKNVWFKMLADFWSKRSASGWANLEYPLHNTEHVFEDSDIIVREDEPSSVIALSLACADYQTKVKEFRSHPNKHTSKHAHTTSQASNSFVEEGEQQQKTIEASLLSDTGTHMKYSFAHGSVKASCKIFYAESFDALRRRCGVAERFVESMSRCLKYDSKGGKTKSIFLKTLDNRFIIKSLQEVELKAFNKFAPDYFAFMSHTLFHGVPSVIAKMFGLFQVTIKNPATGMDFSYYLLVMENLFYERNPNRRFDLKGSMRNRKIESTGQPDEVLLDENLVETIFESPLFVREHARKLLQASVWNDTLWLCKQNVMDYSLMAGFDDERKELVVGIIDCIRTYTWDKKLESWIKDRGKNKPTITSPRDYRNRFRVSMMQYVLQAPNCWHQFQAQMAAPKTLKEKDDQDNTETEGERYVVRRSEG